MNPSTHPHEFVKHTDPDYIIQPGDLFKSVFGGYVPFTISVGHLLRDSCLSAVWTPRPIPPYDTSKYDYVSDPSYVVRDNDLVCHEIREGWTHVGPSHGCTLKQLNDGLENRPGNVYGVLTPKAVDPEPTDTLHDTIRELRATLDRRNEVVVKLVDQIAAMHVALRKIRAAADEASRNTTF